MFEYVSMTVIINQQKGREVEEILWDHNAEDMEDDCLFLNPDQLNYRKLEARIKYVHYLCYFILAGVGTAADVMFMFKPNMCFWILAGFAIGIIWSEFLVTACLLTQMRKYHNFEYNKGKRFSRMYMAIVCFKYSMFVTVAIHEALNFSYKNICDW